MGQSMMSSVIDVAHSPTFTSVYFLTAENWHKVPAKICAICFGRHHGLFGLILIALLLPAKLIAYFFIQNCFKCDYNHYSTAAFGNTWLPSWPKNVLHL